MNEVVDTAVAFAYFTYNVWLESLKMTADLLFGFAVNNVTAVAEEATLVVLEESAY